MKYVPHSSTRGYLLLFIIWSSYQPFDQCFDWCCLGERCCGFFSVLITRSLLSVLASNRIFFSLEITGASHPGPRDARTDATSVVSMSHVHPHWKTRLVADNPHLRVMTRAVYFVHFDHQALEVRIAMEFRERAQAASPLLRCGQGNLYSTANKYRQITRSPNIWTTPISPVSTRHCF